MKRYGYLYEKICDLDNIIKAHYNARKSKGHYREVKMVNQNVEFYAKEIQKMLINKTFKVSKYKVKFISDKGKQRKIAKLPYFPDRIVHWAILQIIEPIFIKNFISQTYSAIPSRGTDKALKDARKAANESLYVLKIDIKKYYNNVDKEILKRKFRDLFKDKELLWILDLIVDSFKEGVPIGNYTSQYFANFYLSELDHKVKEFCRTNYFRYMDDLVIIDTKDRCKKIYKFIKIELEKLNLRLHPYTLKPINNQLVDFVGYRFSNKRIKLRPKVKYSLKQSKRIYKKKKNLNRLTIHNISRYFSLKGKTKHIGGKNEKNH